MTVHDDQVSHRHSTPSDIRKAVRGAAIGNTVEWFDFAVYSVLATYKSEFATNAPDPKPQDAVTDLYA